MPTEWVVIPRKRCLWYKCKKLLPPEKVRKFGLRLKYCCRNHSVYAGIKRWANKRA